MPARAKAVTAGLRDLEPLVMREAARVMRKLPASIDVQDVQQAARLGAWKALEKFDGRGQLEPFALQNIRWAIADWQRSTHPAGRNGPAVVHVSDDELAGMDDGTDHAADTEARDTISKRIAGMPQSARKVVKLALAAVQDAKPRAKTPDAFDPHAVPIRMGVPVPAPAAPRVNKYRALVQRMPATGSVVLGRSQAESLVKELRAAGLRYCTAPHSPTTRQVWREPSAEQLAARTKGKTCGR